VVIRQSGGLVQGVERIRRVVGQVPVPTARHGAADDVAARLAMDCCRQGRADGATDDMPAGLPIDRGRQRLTDRATHDVAPGRPSDGRRQRLTDRATDNVAARPSIHPRHPLA